MYHPKDITEFLMAKFLKPGDIAVDATAGNGHDTLKLCNTVGSTGKVFAFDIQKTALDNTKKLLCENNLNNFDLILDSHSEIDKYIKEPISCVIFNLGYLPSGDHSICTKPETTIEAIEKSLALLLDTGFICITIYWGKNSGTTEKDSVMEYLKKLDHKKYTVTVHDFYNRPNNPPITAVITKNGAAKI